MSHTGKKVCALSTHKVEMVQVTITMNWKFYENHFQGILGRPRFRGRTEESDRNSNNNRLAGLQKKDGYRFKREDSAGNYMADSGEQMPGFDGEKGASLDLSLLKKNFRSAGYILVKIDAYRKFGGNSTKVSFVFAESGDELPKVSYNLFTIATARSFRHVHVWDNGIKGSITVNAACPEQKDFPSLEIKKTEKGSVEVSYESEEDSVAA